MLIRHIRNYLLYGLDETAVINRIKKMPMAEKERLKEWVIDIFETDIQNESNLFYLRMDSASFQLSALIAGGGIIFAFVVSPFSMPMAAVSATVGGIVGFGIFKRASVSACGQSRKEIEERIITIKKLLSVQENFNGNPLRIPRDGH